MFVRNILVTVGLAFIVSSAIAQEMILAVNEGITYRGNGGIHQRYKPLLDLLSAELKRPIKVQEIEKYGDFEQGLAQQRYDLAFIHPAQIGLRAAKSGNYFGLCTAKDFTGYHAWILVQKNSPLKTLPDLQGKKIGVPGMESITTAMFTASLRQMNFSHPEKMFTATQYQDAVPFMIENKFVDAGVTGSKAVAKDWTSKGGRILGETKPIPIKQFLASKRIDDADRLKIQKLLLGLSASEAGRNALANIGITGFVPWNREVMDEAATRLGL